MIFYLILLGSTMLGAVASFYFKKASSSDSIQRTLLEPGLYIGGILYFLSALMDIAALRELDYSVALPLTAVTYIWTMLLAFFFLKEKMSGKKAAGVGLIVLGAVLVAI